jgi:curli biogenesis system outer membrane secretion channel CsgG
MFHKPQIHSRFSLPSLSLLAGALLCAGMASAQIPASAPSEPAPQTSPQTAPQTAPSPQANPGLPSQDSKSRRHANRPTVTIREFRSSVQEIPPRAATEVFITALVESGKFRVVERARLAEGVMQEKALNQAGLASGQSADVRLVAAKYMFEGTVSEAQLDQNSTSAGLNIMGLGAKKTTTRDTIGIDVRVIEVDSGVVADAIKIRRNIKGSATTAGGVGDMATNALSRRFLGGAVGASGGNEYESKNKESLDQALRLAIEDAVKILAERFADE